MHAPQLLVSQPMTVPVLPSFSRRYCTSSMRGSTSSETWAPSTVRLIRVMPTQARRAGLARGWSPSRRILPAVRRRVGATCPPYHAESAQHARWVSKTRRLGPSQRARRADSRPCSEQDAPTRTPSASKTRRVGVRRGCAGPAGRPRRPGCGSRGSRWTPRGCPCAAGRRRSSPGTTAPSAPITSPAGVASRPEAQRVGGDQARGAWSACSSGSAERLMSVSGPVQLTTASARRLPAVGSALDRAPRVGAADAAADQREPPVALVAADPVGDLGRHPVPADLPVAGVRRQEPLPLVEVEPLPDRLGLRPQAVDDVAPVDAVGARGRLDLRAHAAPRARPRSAARRARRLTQAVDCCSMWACGSRPWRLTMTARRRGSSSSSVITVSIAVRPVPTTTTVASPGSARIAARSHGVGEVARQVARSMPSTVSACGVWLP